MDEFIQWFLSIFLRVWQWLEKRKKDTHVKKKLYSDELARLNRNRRRLIALLKSKKRRRNVNRTCWIQPELRNPSRYWEDRVPLLTALRFQKKFRLSVTSFDNLVDELKPYLQRENTNLRPSIPVAKRVAVALYMLKSNADFGTVADIFGIGKSTVGYLLHDFCSVVSRNLYERYVQFPHTPEERRMISNGFLSRWQFPGVVGALDGSHIPIIGPSYCHEDYINYKNYHSIVLMGLVDSGYRFIYTNIGKPGRANDASIFADSGLKRYCENGILLEENLHIIGDGAFPLLEWLLIPYIQTFGMPHNQRYFNFRLSRARVVVENAFGRLKGRWRILLKRADMSLPHMSDIVKTCVVLHNICETNDDKYFSDWDHYVQNANQLYPQPNQIFRQTNVPAFAKFRRDQLAENLTRDGVTFEEG